MNGLALRISKGGGKKSKNADVLPALHISNHLRQDLVDQNVNFRQFVGATDAGGQLKVLKEILNNSEEKYEECVVEFLSVVFFHADSKHPVKKLLAKNIAKFPTLIPQFSKALSKEISSHFIKHATYDLYSEGVYKITPCLENFEPGVKAVSLVDIQLTNWLKDCLQCCVQTLSTSSHLSSTEKNEIFTLCHTSIRLLLHLTTPVTSDINSLVALFGDMLECVKQLLFNDDVPMDTKTVCGILILNMRFMENRGASIAWSQVLKDPEELKGDLAVLLSTDASKLSLYSAVANTVVIDRLTYFLTCLVGCILGVLERNSSESVYVLGVTRTLVTISRNLDKVTNIIVSTQVLLFLLDFVWGYLDHYLDSVRHLTAQIFANLVRFCFFLLINGVGNALDTLFDPIPKLDKHRRSYYIAITALVSELGPDEVMRRIPALVHDVIRALSVQAVQASATTTLEVLLKEYANSKLTRNKDMNRTFIEPVLTYVATQPLDSSVLNVLEGLLVKAVKLDGNVMGFILPNINSPNTQNNANLKCTLMLLSVARKCNALGGDCNVLDDTKWKNVIGYDVLQMAAVDAEVETRILSLSLIVESPKSTEPFTRGELDCVLHYMTYNLNAQSPSFRQLTLSLVKKFLKRLEDSYKSLQRQKNQVYQDMIFSFMSKLRDLCFDSLIVGANYSRRVVALTVLSWCQNMQLESYNRCWIEDEVEKLLYHLEDSYESNKALALAILNKCPKDLIMGKTYSISLDLKMVLKQASSLKPTDCVSAAYKFDLLRNKLPEYILLEEFSDIPEPVAYSLLYRLLNELKGHVTACKRSIVAGAAYSPMYPLVHCMGHTISYIDTMLISQSPKWSALIEDIISTSYSACEAAAPIVNNSSPEGHLPNDLGTANDYGNSHGVTLEDGRQVTAQMVLLCAWRTVKEVSLLLGDLSSLLTFEDEGQVTGSLTTRQVSEMGTFFTRLLAETKHRGAFEQAYVGFMKLLARLWRSRSRELHSLPRQWLDELMNAIASTEHHPALCSTRRSAGLPFMIQALVTTELQVQSNPKCFHQCMTTLLRLARSPKQTNLPSHSNDSDCNGETTDDLIEKTKSNEKRAKDDSKIEQGEEIIKPNNAQKVSNQMTKDKNTNCEEKEQTNVNNYDSKIEQDEEIQETNNRKDSNQITNENCTKSEKKENANSIDPAHSFEPDNVETRTHAINILRALFRNASLDESVASYVGEGLMVALQGFEGSTWMERNSSTLLFSALMVRIFGVQRSKDGDDLCIRNKMTGRIFFLRYPQLYDAMMSKLEEVCSSDDKQISPSLYPVLLLLARLYPSSLEGTVSNLKLVSFVPYVVECAASAVMKTRQLAAKAIVPLIPPLRYVPHLEEMFEAVCDTEIERNTCHGILLQLIKLLEAKPDNLSIDESSMKSLSELVQNTQWILHQATQSVPCYLLADEYVKVVNLLIWGFPLTILDEYKEVILKLLEEILFNESLKPVNTCGREVCLANCLYLYLILLNKKNEHEQICNLVYKSLKHNAYEVVLSVLNYLLILYENIEIENKFLEHLNEISDRNVLKVLRQSDSYTESLCYTLIQTNVYPECRQKMLKIFTLEESTGKCVYGMKTKDSIIPTDKSIMELHFNNIKEEHENLTHIYLESLCNFVTKKLTESNIKGEELLEVIRVVFACSSSDNKDETREVVVKFLELNYDRILEFDLKELNEENKFECKATAYATIVSMLEDDNSCLRQRIADTISKHSGKKQTHAAQNIVLSDGITISKEDIGKTNTETSEEPPKSEDISAIEESLKNISLKNDGQDITQDIATQESGKSDETSIEIPKSDELTAVEDSQKKSSVKTNENDIAPFKYDKSKEESGKTSTKTPKSDYFTALEDVLEDIALNYVHELCDRHQKENGKTSTDDVTAMEDSLKNISIKTDGNDCSQDIAPFKYDTSEKESGKTCTETPKTEDFTNDKTQDIATYKYDRVIPTKAAEILRGSIHDAEILLVIALMDFKSEVIITDDEGDESRVFDTNEKYNIFMEETVWARACGDVIKENLKENTMVSIQQTLKTPIYRPTFDKLCGRNLTTFENVMQGASTDYDFVNPKVKVFFDSLST